MRRPKISIVIPAYNAESTIIETIESVQKQTFSDFEIIIIDDGSTDNTVEVIKNIHDRRIQVISYEHRGVSAARNQGISYANGELIAFLDADDLWTPDKLELQLAALEKYPEAGVAYSWTYFMYQQGKVIKPGHPVYFKGDVYANLLVENFLAHGSNPLIRRQVIDCIGEYDLGLTHSEDWDFYIRLASHCDFALVPKHQIFYRQSSGSTTSKIDGIEKQMLVMFEKTFKAAPTQYQYLKNRSLAWVYQYCTQQYLEYSTDLIGINQATKKLWKAIRLHPQILLGEYAQSLIRWLVKRWIKIQPIFLIKQGKHF
jgi:glycosyltransferase involved in cell wall biosynthesis